MHVTLAMCPAERSYCALVRWGAHTNNTTKEVIYG